MLEVGMERSVSVDLTINIFLTLKLSNQEHQDGAGINTLDISASDEFSLNSNDLILTENVPSNICSNENIQITKMLENDNMVEDSNENHELSEYFEEDSQANITTDNISKENEDMAHCATNNMYDHYADDEPDISYTNDCDSPIYDADSPTDFRDKPLYPGSRLTLTTTMLLILTFVMRHGLTGEAIQDLLLLLEMHCLADNLCCTSLKMYKDFFTSFKSPIEMHFMCEFCELYIGKEKPDKCTICQQSSNIKYFLVVSLISQLKTILSRPNMTTLMCNKSRRKLKKDNIEDVYDGELYKQHFDDTGHFRGTPENKKSSELHLSMQLNTDGVALFRSSALSVWPLYAVINELPPRKRFSRENRLFIGLWFGKTKPTMKIFMRPVVNDFNILQKEGLKLILDGRETVVRCILLSTVADAPARSLMMDLVQFNGNFGCPCCYLKGESCATSARGHSHVYPFEQANIRTHEETLAYGREAESKQKSVQAKTAAATFGVKGLSPLSILSRFDLIKGTGIDYMHCILLGVVKSLTVLWFDVKHRKSPWSMRSRMTALNEKLGHICPPNCISRVPRSLSDLVHWKASEYRTFLLYCSLPLLHGELPDLYYQHYLLLVEAVFILLKSSISTADLKKAKCYLAEFTCKIKHLYGERYQTFNMHCLTHLADKVRQIGPLWAQSCFFYESLNGDLRKMFHGTQQIELQIALSVSIQQNIPSLVEKLPIGSAAAVLYERMNDRHRLTKNTFSITTDIRGVGSIDTFIPNVELQTKIETNFGRILHFKIFKRISVGNLVIHSKSYSIVKRRNSYTVCLEDGTFAQIQYYLFCAGSLTNHYIAVYRKFEKTNLEISKHEFAKASHLIPVKLNQEVRYTPIINIKELCFPVDIPTVSFISKFPNSVECD